MMRRGSDCTSVAAKVSSTYFRIRTRTAWYVSRASRLPQALERRCSFQSRVASTSLYRTGAARRRKFACSRLADPSRPDDPVQTGLRRHAESIDRYGSGDPAGMDRIEHHELGAGQPRFIQI